MTQLFVVQGFAHNCERRLPPAWHKEGHCGSQLKTNQSAVSCNKSNMLIVAIRIEIYFANIQWLDWSANVLPVARERALLSDTSFAWVLHVSFSTLTTNRCEKHKQGKLMSQQCHSCVQLVPSSTARQHVMHQHSCPQLWMGFGNVLLVWSFVGVCMCVCMCACRTREGANESVLIETKVTMRQCWHQKWCQ